MSFCKSSRFIYIGLFVVVILVIGWGISVQRMTPSSVVVGRCTMQPPKITVTNYNTAWCGHSNRLRPTWNKLQQEFKNHPSIDVIDFRCDGGPQQQKVCQEIGIQGFPTVLLSLENGQTYEYRGDRSLQDLKQWIRNTTNTGLSQNDSSSNPPPTFSE